MSDLVVPNSRNICPYCQTTVKFEEPQCVSQRTGWQGLTVTAFTTQTPKEELVTIPSFCPHCLKTIISLAQANEIRMIWPIAASKAPAPQEVPISIANDYNEASIVLQFSPKASAALSRRCLQSVLMDAGKTTKKDLSDQIDEVLTKLPAYIAENLDAVRNIGNFAAHEQKSKVTGLILDVEQGEAEWNLDVLESLFDFYYVKPEIERKKRESFAQKLAEAGKPPLKQP